MYYKLLDYFEFIYSYEYYVHIIFILLLAIILFLLILKKNKIRLGIIKYLKYFDYPRLLNIPLLFLALFILANLIIFFIMPDRTAINPIRPQSLSVAAIHETEFPVSFQTLLLDLEYQFRKKMSLYEFFGYYNPIFFIELFSSLFFLYMILLTIFFGTDFI
jgi:hypothetical protein